MLLGALFDESKSYDSSFILATCCFVAASLVLWLEIPAQAYMERIEKKKEEKEKEMIDEEEGKDLRDIFVQEMIYMS